MFRVITLKLHILEPIRTTELLTFPAVYKETKQVFVLNIYYEYRIIKKGEVVESFPCGAGQTKEVQQGVIASGEEKKPLPMRKI